MPDVRSENSATERRLLARFGGCLPDVVLRRAFCIRDRRSSSCVDLRPDVFETASSAAASGAGPSSWLRIQRYRRYACHSEVPVSLSGIDSSSESPASAGDPAVDVSE